MTSFRTDPPLEPRPDPLVRFVADGLLATTDSFLTGRLPLHRLAWELRVRIDALAELCPPPLGLTRLRWLHRDVERLLAALADAGRSVPTAEERSRLAGTVAGLRSTLASLVPRDPFDPAGAARPMRVDRVTAAVNARRSVSSPVGDGIDGPVGGVVSGPVGGVVA
jgi:hypothetical protein